MSLVERRLDALTGFEGLVAGEAAGDRTIEVCARHRVLQATAEAQALDVTDIQNHVRSRRTRSVEVDGQKQPGNADLVVLEAVVSRVRVRVDFETHLAVELLLPSQLEVVLRVGTDVAHTLVDVGRVVADEAGQ